MTTIATATITRVDAIADSIFTNMRDAFTAVEGVKALSQEMQNASADATNKREALMSTLAYLSNADAWTPTEVDKAIKEASKKLNNKDAAKTFSTLIAEVRLAAHPSVRADFARYVDMRNRIWGAEQDAAAAAKKAEMPVDAPCKLAFQGRSYHMLVAMLRRSTKDGAAVFMNDDEVIAYARSLDPRFDVEKVAKKIEGLANSLREFYGSHKLDCIKTVLEYLNTITKDDLNAELKELAEKQAAEMAEKAAAEQELLGDAPNDPAAPASPFAQPSPALAPIAPVDPVDALLAEMAA